MEVIWGDGHLIQVYGCGDGKTKLETIADTGNPQAIFRHLILKLTAAGTDYYNTTQFSAWQFITPAGAIFRYPSGMSLSWSNNISFFTGEGLSKAVISDVPSTSMGKACFKTRSSPAYPKYFRIDLGDSPIDIKKYSKWRWYTSNDTADEYGARNLRSFELFVTNKFTSFDDQTDWISVDSQENYVAPRTNFTEAYVGTMKIKAQEMT